jgi:hypothetical protein
MELFQAFYFEGIHVHKISTLGQDNIGHTALSSVEGVEPTLSGIPELLNAPP